MPEINQIPLDPKQDLAAFEAVGTRGSFQLWIGGAPVITDAGVSAVVSAKIYELMALLPDATVTTFIVGTHVPNQAVIAAQAVYAIGQQVPYWNAGKFNHEAVQWPAGVALDSYAERKAFLIGTMLHVGHLI